jgi:hypothetical protein
METATFFVQLEDHPPTVPVLLGPSDGAEVPDLSGRLTWLESTDPDEDNGDYVAGYRVQVDDDPDFGSLEIDVEDVALAGDAPALLAPNASGAISVMLSELAGSGDMVLGTLYYWRVNAKDSHGVSSDWSAGPASFVFGTDQQAPSCAISSPADDATLTDLPIVISGSATDDLSGIDFVEVSTDGGSTWTEAVGDESWSHQWWPALSGDYQLTCRATDISGNLGTAAPSITVHADLERTLEFPTSSASGSENMGTYDVTVTLSGPRAVEVAVDLEVSGSAVSGVDYETLPEALRFYPGQTSVTFTITVIDDPQSESEESLVIDLANPNVSDVLIAGDGRFTLTIVDNDAPRPPEVFEDGFEDGDLERWSETVQ